jgi:simple sugar transport system ATP-binding protein
LAEPDTISEPVVPPTAAAEDILRVEHIAKRYGPITALRDVNLHLKKGEVLGLVGDNGSGKSTLMKTICGFQQADEGQMFLDGEPYEPRSVDQARALGVDAVYQDLALVDDLTVFHNMFLRREKVRRPLPLLSMGEMRRATRSALDEIGINLPRLDAPVARLSGGQRQAIAVARTVFSDAEIILLDEPLAAMGVKEGAMILDLIDRLKKEGTLSIIIVAHNYAQVFEICDRVNLLDNGVIAFDKPTSETSVEELTDIVVNEYRRARAATAAGDGGATQPPSDTE